MLRCSEMTFLKRGGDISGCGSCSASGAGAMAAGATRAPGAAVGTGEVEGIERERALREPPAAVAAAASPSPSAGNGSERWCTMGGVKAWKMRGVAGLPGDCSPPLSGVLGPLLVAPREGGVGRGGACWFGERKDDSDDVGANLSWSAAAAAVAEFAAAGTADCVLSPSLSMRAPAGIGCCMSCAGLATPTGVMEISSADMLSVALRLFLFRGACAISRSSALLTRVE